MIFFKQAVNDIITLLSAPPSTTTISLEYVDPTRNALLKIADKIKIFESLPPQLPLADTVALPRVKEVLTVTPLLRMEKKNQYQQEYSLSSNITPNINLYTSH